MLSFLQRVKPGGFYGGVYADGRSEYFVLGPSVFDPIKWPRICRPPVTQSFEISRVLLVPMYRSPEVKSPQRVSMRHCRGKEVRERVRIHLTLQGVPFGVLPLRRGTS